MENLPAKNADPIKLKKIYLGDSQFMAWSPREKSLLLMMGLPKEDKHLTIGCYEKEDKLVMDGHLTVNLEDGEKTYESLLEFTINYKKLGLIAESKKEEITDRLRKILESSSKPIKVEDIVKLKGMVFPVRSALTDTAWYNQKVLNITSMQDMSKLGMLTDASTLFDTEFSTAMIMGDKVRDWLFIYKKDGSYYAFKPTNFIKEYLTIMAEIYDQAITIEDKMNKTFLKFSDILPVLVSDFAA